MPLKAMSRLAGRVHRTPVFTSKAVNAIVGDGREVSLSSTSGTMNESRCEHSQLPLQKDQHSTKHKHRYSSKQKTCKRQARSNSEVP